MDEKALIEQISCLKLEAALAECLLEKQGETISKLSKVVKKKNHIIALLTVVAGVSYTGYLYFSKENKDLKKKLKYAEEGIE